MIPYMVGKLAPNSSHLTMRLVKYVPGRGSFRAVPSQNGDKVVTSPPLPQSLNGSIGVLLSVHCKLAVWTINGITRKVAESRRTEGILSVERNIGTATYGQYIQQSMDQPGMVANPVRGRLIRENVLFSVLVRA